MLWHGIGFDRKGKFSVSNGFGRNCIIFGVDMCSSVHVDNKKNVFLILGEDPTQGLDDTTLTAERKYSINFTVTRKKLCLSLHYKRANSYLFVNDTKIHKFKPKNSEIKVYPLYLESISKGFSLDNLKKTGLNGYVYDFSVNYNAIAVDDILENHKYLMKKNSIV